MDEEERAGISRYDWDVQQLAWRRSCIATDCNNDTAKFRQEYPSNDREAFRVTGDPVFNPEIVETRIAQAATMHPLFIGHIYHHPHGRPKQ